MKKLLTLAPAAILAAIWLLALSTRGRAESVDPEERAFRLASRFTDMGYYVTPFRDSLGALDPKCELTVPVSSGLEYVFVVAGNHNCVDLDVWVEAEETGNTFAADSHYRHTGLGGVRWRAEHDGEVQLVVHFAKFSSRCGWNAILGRRSSPSAEFGSQPAGNDHVAPDRRVIAAAPQAGA
jgi:hypothetical protein